MSEQTAFLGGQVRCRRKGAKMIPRVWPEQLGRGGAL